MNARTIPVNPYRGKTSLPPIARFENLFIPEPNSGCWLWTGALDAKGYGVFSLPGRKRVRAHRFSFEFYCYEVRADLDIDHLCRMRSCVNPDHLEPVTHKENMRRSPVVGKWDRGVITHCPHGHEYTPDNSYLHKGVRHCRSCGRIRSLRRYHERATKNL